MATVVSLTESKIQELMSGWEGVSLSQDNINALIQQLQVILGENSENLTHFNETVRPQLEADLAGNALALNEVLSNHLPTVQQRLDQAQLDLEDLGTNVIPAIQEQVVTNANTIVEAPKVYVQDEAPENPDLEDRYLVVGDVWYKSNENNLQHIWNGVEWTTFGVDIPDFSLTVKKFQTSSHMIY